jgi:hypothetical protein
MANAGAPFYSAKGSQELAVGIGQGLHAAAHGRLPIADKIRAIRERGAN